MKLSLQIILLIMAAYTCFAQENACDITWDSVKQFINDDCPNVTPSIISVGDTVHLFWYAINRHSCDANFTGIFYSHSFNGGQTFSIPIKLVPGDSVYGASGVPAVSGKYVYVLYPIWLHSSPQQNLALLRSTDGGVTWEPRRRLGDFGRMSIAAHDSSVYIHFKDTDSLYHRYSGVMASRDYGVTWDTIALGLPRAESSVGGFGMFTATDAGLHIVYDVIFQNAVEVGYMRSMDYGYTWSEPETLSTLDGTNSSLSRIAADDDGNIFTIWNDQSYGGNFGGTIVLKKSSDNGETWQDQTIISEEAIANFSHISIKDSIVIITWNRDYDETDTGGVHIRMSENLGRDWCPIRRAASGTNRLGDPAISVSGKSLFLAWTYYPRPAYIYIHFSKSVIQTADTGSEPQLPVETKLFQNYPNPFNPVTYIRFEVGITDEITIRIYNIIGYEVATLMDKKLVPGVYTIPWDAQNLPAGVYFCSMTTRDRTDIKKIILVK